MKKKVFTYLIGGQAGHGIKKAGLVAAQFFADMQRSVFQMNDYPSLIRGGHNFSIVSSGVDKIYNHYMLADLIVALDKKSYTIHQKHLAENGVMVFNSDEVDKGNGVGIQFSSLSKEFEKSDLIKGVAGIAILAAVVGKDKDTLRAIIKSEYSTGKKDNLSFSSTIYDLAKKTISKTFSLEQGKKIRRTICDGNQCIGLGAAAAGLDIYFAYPMTPASGLLHFFAAHKEDLNIVAVHPENEIAVANMAIGSAATGARTLVGTSGGGFCLMQEAFSLAGMCEAPVLFYLGQRPGPSTGVPTYTEQADLLMALHPGQGEFPRIVASPGTLEEAFYLTAELLNLVWRFQTPGILLSEKHLVESAMSVTLKPDAVTWTEAVTHKGGKYNRYFDTEDGISPLSFPPSSSVIKWNSYEHTEEGLTTEKPEEITQMHDKRRKKLASIIEFMANITTVNVFDRGGPPYIFTFGSTTMSVLEAIEYDDINATIVQPVYLNPFPVWELEKYQDEKEICVVEQNSTGQLERLLRDTAGIPISKSIQKYNGRPFDPIELSTQLKEVT